MAPIAGRTHKGELTQPHITHQALQMDGMAELIFEGKQPVVPVDGEEAVKDLRIIDAIFEAAKQAKNSPVIVNGCLQPSKRSAGDSLNFY